MWALCQEDALAVVGSDSTLGRGWHPEGTGAPAEDRAGGSFQGLSRGGAFRSTEHLGEELRPQWNQGGPVKC